MGAKPHQSLCQVTADKTSSPRHQNALRFPIHSLNRILEHNSLAGGAKLVMLTDIKPIVFNSECANTSASGKLLIKESRHLDFLMLWDCSNHLRVEHIDSGIN